MYIFISCIDTYIYIYLYIYIYIYTFCKFKKWTRFVFSKWDRLKYIGRALLEWAYLWWSLVVAIFCRVIPLSVVFHCYVKEDCQFRQLWEGILGIGPAMKWLDPGKINQPTWLMECQRLGVTCCWQAIGMLPWKNSSRESLPVKSVPWNHRKNQERWKKSTWIHHFPRVFFTVQPGNLPGNRQPAPAVQYFWFWASSQWLHDSHSPQACLFGSLWPERFALLFCLVCERILLPATLPTGKEFCATQNANVMGIAEICLEVMCIWWLEW